MDKEHPITVVLADDHAIVREGFAALCASHGMQILGQASDGLSALELIGRGRPDFAILAYPGYLKAKDKDELTPGLRVPPGTPPVFLAHGGDDIISPPEHSVLMYLALKRAGIPAELHVYAGSTHDFGVRTNEHSCSAWTEACTNWLRQQGFLNPVSTP